MAALERQDFDEIIPQIVEQIGLKIRPGGCLISHLACRTVPGTINMFQGIQVRSQAR